MARLAASTARLVPVATRRAHHRVALAVHDGFHVGKIAIDDAGNGDDVAEIPCTAWRRISSAMRNASKKLVPRSTVSIRRSLGITMTVSTQPINSCNRLFGLQHAALAFEGEWLGDHGNAQRAEFAGQRSYHRRGAAAGAAAESGGDENHVRAFERLR